MIRELRPAGLDELGLTEAIEGYLTQVKSEIYHKKPVLEWHLEKPPKPISDQIKINLFRIIQEALNNAIVHANANYIKIELHFCNDEGIIEIIDDGKGFSVPNRLSLFAKSDHFGLIGISERVSVIGGKIDVTSGAKTGTRISVKVNIGK